MRLVAVALAFFILVLQYPLWLGKGGWLRVWELDRQVSAQKDQNTKLQQRNAGLDAEVRDLKQGFEAVEERARYELGMVRQDEVFFQVLPPGSVAQPAPKLVPEQGEKASARPAAKAETGKGEKADAKAASANAPAAAAASN
jgi:cell division protein FtsB